MNEGNLTAPFIERETRTLKMKVTKAMTITRTAKTLIVSAAMAGLVAGTVITITGCSNSDSNKAGASADTSASDSASAKHDCKGLNSCKGTGGCKTSDQGCKGKNSCKGKGGCKVA